MKSFSIAAVLSLLIAFAGILSQHGEANLVSGLSVAPLGVFVLILLVNAVGSLFKGSK